MFLKRKLPVLRPPNPRETNIMIPEGEIAIRNFIVWPDL